MSVSDRRANHIAKRFGLLLGFGLFAAGPGAGAEVAGYDFSAAAQEITQLYWLAETAEVCGWTTAADAARFKHFALRFLRAHLSELNRAALSSLVTADSYEGRVRRAAEEGAGYNCSSNRWHMAWVSYKTAADEHGSKY